MTGSTVGYYDSVGMALEILSHSPYHKRFRVGEFLEDAILPPLFHHQAHFQVDEQGEPVALVTWAWVTEGVERELHATGRSLRFEEWRCGSRLFFNDWITPFGNVRALVRHMTEEVFPDREATSLRRHPDGRVRRVCHWTGARLRARPEGGA